MDGPGPIYTAEQIVIPPSLPDILKGYTKAAIRTQPVDILEWSEAYFTTLANGEVPPVKERYELATDSNGGLSKGRLATLHKQLKESVSLEELKEKWTKIGCEETKLSEILSLGGINSNIDIQWSTVLALSCTVLQQNMTEALKVMCEIMSSDPEGGDARISYELFSELYTFLAKIDGDISDNQMKRVLTWLHTESARFDGKVGPREFLHPGCPKLTTKLQ